MKSTNIVWQLYLDMITFLHEICSYTNFGALFSTVDVDFRFSDNIKIFEIAKFVYCLLVKLIQTV